MAAVVWLFIAAYTLLGAIALYPSAQVKAGMGPILMWALALLYLIAGLAGIVAPGSIRAAARTFLTRNASRIVGIAYVILGAGLFRVAAGTAMPLLAQIVGVIAFVEGGVQILQPVVCIVMIEWWLDKRDAWYRAAGLVSLLLAALFAYASGTFLTARPAPATPAAVETSSDAPTALPSTAPPPEAPE